MRLAIALGCTGLLWASSITRADDGPPPPPPPAEGPMGPPMLPPSAPVMVQPPQQQPVDRFANVDKGTLEDANAGRVAIMPTALTPPAGTWSFEDEELFFIGASYAVTDQFVLSASTMVPITSSLYWGYLSGKYQVLKQGQLRVALQAGAFGVLYKDSNIDSSGNSTSTSTTTSAFEIGGAATYCLDSDCYSHVDGAIAAGFAHQNQSAVPVAFMGGVVARISKHVRLVVEADTGHSFGSLSGQANGILAWYGLRFTSRQIGVDLELVRPFCGGTECDSSTFPLGFPFVAFSYRGLE